MAGDMRAAELSPEDRAIIFRRQGGLCFFCRHPLASEGPIFAHLVPRHAGGSHHRDNRVAVHSHCEAANNGRERSSKAPLPSEEQVARLREQIAAYEVQYAARAAYRAELARPPSKGAEFRAWAAALAAAETARWRPIETINPENWTDRPALLANRYGDLGPAIWWRGKWHWWADGAVIAHQSDFGTEYKEFEVPTHWRQPLPPPPSG